MGLFVSWIVMLCSQVALGQQQNDFTRYMYNISSYNPSYVNSDQYITFLGSYRNQWVGLQGAPKTFRISGNTLLNDSNFGLGFHFDNESIGVINSNNFALDFSYRIALNRMFNLAVGLKASIDSYRVNYNDLDFWDSSDPFAEIGQVRKANPNFGLGLFFWWDKGYLSLSMPYVFTEKSFDSNLMQINGGRNHTYLSGGYLVSVSEDIVLKPAAMLRFVNGAPLSVSISGLFYYKEKVNIGGSYAFNSAWSLLAGYQVLPAVFLGYSFDRSTSRLGAYNGGTHEVFVRYEIFKTNSKAKTTKYF